MPSTRMPVRAWLWSAVSGLVSTKAYAHAPAVAAIPSSSSGDERIVYTSALTKTTE